MDAQSLVVSIKVSDDDVVIGRSVKISEFLEKIQEIVPDMTWEGETNPFIITIRCQCSKRERIEEIHARIVAILPDGWQDLIAVI